MIGFTLLTLVPTAGTSVAGGLALTGLAYDIYAGLGDYEDFKLMSAATDTDVDKVRSLSDLDPSLTPLLFRILSAGVNITTAAGLFRRAVQMRRMAMASSVDREALDALNQAGEARGVKGVGDEATANAAVRGQETSQPALNNRVAGKDLPESAAGSAEAAHASRRAIEPVEATGSGTGIETDGMSIRASRAAAIERGYADVTGRQAELLENLPTPGSRITVPKRAVNVNDIAALTAKTGDEFTVFTRGSQRMVVRGTPAGVDMSVTELTAMKKAGWKWSGHTHPGTSDLVLNASGHPGDRAVLEIFGQDRSLILNSRGARNVFDQGDNTYIPDGGHGR